MKSGGGPAWTAPHRGPWGGRRIWAPCAVLLLLWNSKSITSLLWIPKTMYHVLGIELHMKQKFTECLTKRHRSTAEYFYVVTQSLLWNRKTLER
jgi:hypothetical protein